MNNILNFTCIIHDFAHSGKGECRNFHVFVENAKKTAKKPSVSGENAPFPPGSSDHETTVNPQYLAGDKGCVLSAEEAGRAGHVFWRA